MPPVLLIVGEQGSGKTCAARVAAQIAEQHHHAVAQVLDGEVPARKPVTGRQAHALLIVTKCPDSRARIKAHRVIHLDRFARWPRGKALTFALREAVDDCLAIR
ncbi:hypothetical protein GCM10027202_12300 [Microvirgula curvata]